MKEVGKVQKTAAGDFKVGDLVTLPDGLDGIIEAIDEENKYCQIRGKWYGELELNRISRVQKVVEDFRVGGPEGQIEKEALKFALRRRSCNDNSTTGKVQD